MMTKEHQKEYAKERYQKNKEHIKECSKEWRKNNIEHKKEYDKEYYQKNKESLTKRILTWRENNIERYEAQRKKRRNTERGFMRTLWQSIKDSGRDNSFKDFDDFYNHWLEQKKIYGMKCPATGVEMTTKSLFNKKEKYKRCETNISKDRILSWMGYSHQNLIFTTWAYNKRKGSVTPKLAKAFLRTVKERYGTDEMERSDAKWDKK